MTPGLAFGWAALALAGLLLVAHLATVVLALWSARRAGPSPVAGRIALLRPVCGVDAFDAETLASSFAQDWPEVELIFCAPSESDPAVRLVRDLIAAHPGAHARLLTGQQPLTGNPKLDNLWKGWQATDAEWVCMADSNLMLPPDYLRSLAASWGPGVGLVSAPPRGSRPAGLWGHLECAFLNSNQARLQLATDRLGQGFAQGKTLFWHRPSLEHWGGLRALGGWLAEDVASTKLVRAQGLRVRLAPRLFAQPVGRRSFRHVWDRQLRWSRVRRDGFALLFAGEWANGAVVPAVLAGLGLWLTAGPMALLPAGLALWYGAELLLMRRMGWPAGPLAVLALPLRDVLLPVLWLATFGGRGIVWRGHDMAAPREAASADAPQAGAAT